MTNWTLSTLLSCPILSVSPSLHFLLFFSLDFPHISSLTLTVDLHVEKVEEIWWWNRKEEVFGNIESIMQSNAHPVTKRNVCCTPAFDTLFPLIYNCLMCKREKKVLSIHSLIHEKGHFSLSHSSSIEMNNWTHFPCSYSFLSLIHHNSSASIYIFTLWPALLWVQTYSVFNQFKKCM